MNSRSTLYPVLTDASKNSHPKMRAVSAPSSHETCLSAAMSHLFPTSMNAGLSSRTFRTASYNSWILSYDALEVTEYTKAKPWLSLMYDLNLELDGNTPQETY